MPLDSKARFSSRVANYVKYRPSYPSAVLDLLVSRLGLSASSVIADVGSGTGISTALLLQSGATVFAIEPNREMREAAEVQIGAASGFRSVDAAAEVTGLADSSVDLVVCCQAFHWFDFELARAEFRRILRGDRWVALVWNDRAVAGSNFIEGYETLLKTYSPEYLDVKHKDLDGSSIEPFFLAGTMTMSSFPNSQRFDYEGLEGRLLSSSYAPVAGDPGYEGLIEGLRDLFARYSSGGVVEFPYDTKVFLGRV